MYATKRPVTTMAAQRPIEIAPASFAARGGIDCRVPVDDAPLDAEVERQGVEQRQHEADGFDAEEDVAEEANRIRGEEQQPAEHHEHGAQCDPGMSRAQTSDTATRRSVMPSSRRSQTTADRRKCTD